MSRTDQNPDASMEEILASIRRIISEDAGDDLMDARPRRDRQPAPKPAPGNAFANELARALDEQTDDDGLVEAEDDDILDLDRTPAARSAPVAAPRLDAPRPQPPRQAPTAAARPTLADPPPLARRTPAPMVAVPPAPQPIAPVLRPVAAPVARTEASSLPARPQPMPAPPTLRSRTAEIAVPRPAPPLTPPLSVAKPVAAKAPATMPPVVAKAAPPTAAPAPIFEAGAADDEIELTGASASPEVLNGSRAGDTGALDEAGDADDVISLGAFESTSQTEAEPAAIADAPAPRIVAEEIAAVAEPTGNALATTAATAPAVAAATVTAVAAAPGIGSMLLPVRSLEDTVAELLKPMLREWLDANMPRIIARALTPGDSGKSLGGKTGS